MAERVIDVAALVDRIDPERLRRQEVEYEFGGGRIQKKAPQAMPGETYPWLTDTFPEA